MEYVLIAKCATRFVQRTLACSLSLVREGVMGSGVWGSGIRDQGSGIGIRGQSLLSTQSEFVNRKYPTADPKSRLLSRGWRKWNASHRVADAASSLVSASNTKSSRASIAGPS